MKKNLVIKDRGKTIYFKNRKVRTPCTLEVTDKEIIKLQISLKMADIQHYSVKLLNKDEEFKQIIDFTDHEVVIEELDWDPDKNEKSKTILEKLMNGESQ